MATKKKSAEEMIEVDAPEIDTEAAEPQKAEDNKLQQENSELKQQMADMQRQMLEMQNQVAEQLKLMQQMAAGNVEKPRPLTQVEKDAQEARALADKAAKEGTDPWTLDFEMFVPHRDPGEDKWYWLSINDRTAQIPADDSRQVMKLPFALVLADTLKAKRREEAYMDNVQVYDPLSNPHQNGKL